MPLFGGIQHIRVGVKFAIAGLLMVIGVVAISAAYYQTIRIVEQAQQDREQTRELAEDVGRLDALLESMASAITETEMRFNTTAVESFSTAAQAYGNALRTSLSQLRSEEDRQSFSAALQTLGFWDTMDQLAGLNLEGTSLPVVEIREARQELGSLLTDLELRNFRLRGLVRDYERQDLQAENAALADLIQLSFLSLIILGFALAVALAIAKFGVLNPVRRIQATVEAVRGGDTEARTRMESRDELGQMATVLDSLLDEKEAALASQAAENKKLNDSIITLIQSVFRISQRDLTIRVPVAEDITGAVADSINQLTDSIEDVLREVSAVSSEVNETSNEVRAQSGRVIQHADKEQEEIGETLQGLDSAIQAMQLIAKLAAVSNSASKRAINTADNARGSVSATIDSINKIRQTIHEAEKRIKRLGERSQEIGGIIGLINNISERTHILSLNASMHAASAGEAGRGLMVVVDEVQRLAENSREATAEIESLIGNIQMETADTIHVINTVIEDVVAGTRQAEEAGERMEETRNTTQSLVESVVRIARSATSQAKLAQGLRERAGSINDFSRATNTEMQAQLQLSERLVRAADELQGSISVFKLQALEDQSEPELIEEAETV
ncbi:methyl-accepting chemotaxis protein [Marinobacterium mangrovicola]|uniref:Methyl-accepting chemotaxis protein n=1 Tax=Marinobacterium mangrovicola TaxID=1476959 RepID=A0A4R1GAW1_9GAMM|nr:HAMP domain-containing methyl-accepting chemotaxis protein [Marinobacterium mangrovicola]TCK04928.1 methyl-accepting chemotaxis protein [Marinobacterium mangrovicola]